LKAGGQCKTADLGTAVRYAHGPGSIHRPKKQISMFKPVRAAAYAVAFFAFAASASWGGAVSADAVATTSYADHADAGPEVSDLGLNDAAPVHPALPAVAGLNLDARVAAALAADPGSDEENCLANAVYFEARGESLEGQLAVAEVVMNRAASGLYPTSYCGVVRQRSQFSFVRRGQMPAADRASEAWQRAVAIARVAEEGAMRILPDTVLWYHARYVAPRWRRHLAESARIGLHIFYS
jgi:spore germination cell wall hydrolase CwlJ-like protein